MLSKAQARMAEEEKETVFVISGRVWTVDRIEKSAKRNKWPTGTELPAGMSFPSVSTKT